MKKNWQYIILALLCLINVGCNSTTQSSDSLKNSQHEYSLTPDNSNNNNDTAELTVISDSTTFNFGNIQAGDTIKHTFHFKNTGESPLVISSATATCGCTVASFNKRPIATGATDSITAVFASSKENKGFANKVVTVNYNSPASPKLLTLYGRVSN
jgi:hypothetical protein